MRRMASTVVMIAVVTLGLEAVDIGHIHFDAIERLDEYRSELESLLRYEPWLGSWFADEYWDAPISKADLLGQVRRVYRLIGRFPEPDNQEYLLLRAVISEYRYHLSDLDAFGPTVEHYLAVEQLPEYDYRYRWFLGLFYAYALRPFDSIEQFRLVEAEMRAEDLHPAFFGDYGIAAVLANMEATARVQFDRMARAGWAHPTYRELSDQLAGRRVLLSPDSSLAPDQTWRMLERRSGIGLFSRPLGLWIPLEPDWRMRHEGLSNGLSFIAIAPPPARSRNGDSVGYTILVMAYVDPTRIESDWLARFGDRRRFRGASIDRIQLYEYRDRNLYPQMGGARGLLGVARSPVPDLPTVGIEEPSLVPGLAATGAGAYRFGGSYTRIPTELGYVFFLDASDEIFAEASATFLTFLEGVTVE